ASRRDRDGLPASRHERPRRRAPDPRRISQAGHPHAQHAFRRHAGPPGARCRRTRLHLEKCRRSRPGLRDSSRRRRRNRPRARSFTRAFPERRTQFRPDSARTRNPATDRRRQFKQSHRRPPLPERQHRCRPSRQYYGRARHSQNRRASRLRHSQRSGEYLVNRRSFLLGMAGLAAAPLARAKNAFHMSEIIAGQSAATPGFRLVDVTNAAGIQFRHNSGAYGGKLLPETLGSGCAFLDYDADGWQDVLLVNGSNWPGHSREYKSEPTTLKLYRNNRNGTFSDVTRNAGLDIEMYGMGVAIGDYNNDGYPDILITCVGQNRLFRNTGKGTFVDVTKSSGLGNRQAFSTSALWFDFDRDGLLDLFVCNYVKWSEEHDVFCSRDGKHKSYCTPEAYRGETCWLFHNRGNGTFEDVTATSGIFDSSSNSLGIAMLDYDHDGWPDLLIANDTQPNKLYRNQRNGTFQD